MNSKTCSISGRKRRASELQLRMIVSNLNRFLLVLVQVVYSFPFIIRYKIGPIYAAWSSATLA